MNETINKLLVYIWNLYCDNKLGGKDVNALTDLVKEIKDFAFPAGILPLIKFINVKDGIPDELKLCLVKTVDEEDLCLAQFRNSNAMWEVQPFLGKWYQTRSGVIEWVCIEDIIFFSNKFSFVPTWNVGLRERKNNEFLTADQARKIIKEEVNIKTNNIITRIYEVINDL